MFHSEFWPGEEDKPLPSTGASRLRSRNFNRRLRGDQTHQPRPEECPSETLHEKRSEANGATVQLHHEPPAVRVILIIQFGRLIVLSDGITVLNLALVNNL